MEFIASHPPTLSRKKGTAMRWIQDQGWSCRVALWGSEQLGLEAVSREQRAKPHKEEVGRPGLPSPACCCLHIPHMLSLTIDNPGESQRCGSPWLRPWLRRVTCDSRPVPVLPTSMQYAWERLLTQRNRDRSTSTDRSLNSGPEHSPIHVFLSSHRWARCLPRGLEKCLDLWRPQN